MYNYIRTYYLSEIRNAEGRIDAAVRRRAARRRRDEVLFELRRHFALQNVIHWIKSIAIQKEDVGRYPGIVDDVSVGHYKPINSSRYLNDAHEYIFHLTRDGGIGLDRLAVGVPSSSTASPFS